MSAKRLFGTETDRSALSLVGVDEKAAASGRLRASGFGKFIVPALILNLAAGLFATAANAAPAVAVDDNAAGSRHVAESYSLPLSPLMDQGDSDLCWAYATLSMLETNYLYRHPGSHIVLSRGALQLQSIADRFRRLISGNSSHLEDGGIAVDALTLIRQGGLFAQEDFHDIVDSDSVFASVKSDLAGFADLEAKDKALESDLGGSLGHLPRTTHLDGKAVTPQQLAQTVLAGRVWVEFDLSHDGFEGWGPSKDPDARPETHVRYAREDLIVDLIHRSLARGEAVVLGSTDDHALLIYGGEYDETGKPISYLIKDSFPPYAHKAPAETIHRELTDITVAVPDSTIETTASASGGVSAR
jgi:hypothetical protein